MRRGDKGITLIALVITIIVLLILAGISINLTIGDQGIVTRAQQASKNYKDAEEQEQKELSDFDKYMNNLVRPDVGDDSDVTDDEENYDDVTGGELKVMTQSLKILAAYDYTKDLLPETRTMKSWVDYKQWTIIDKETGVVEPAFQSSNSILKPYKKIDNVVYGFDPDKYWIEPMEEQTANSPWALEFKTNADEMIFFAMGNIRISVDNLDGKGYYMSSYDGYSIKENTGNDGSYIYVDFGESSTGYKNIKIENGVGGAIGQIITNNSKKIEAIDDEYKQEKILFLGDSWTEGKNIEDAKEYLSYSNTIADRLNMTCINSGLGGSGYNDIKVNNEHIDEVPYAYDKRIEKQLQTFTPDIIVINGGINDLLKDFTVEQVEGRADSLYKILKEYKDSHNGCKVVIMGVEYYEGGFEFLKINELNEALIKKAKEYGFPYIDYVTGDTYGANGNKITQGKGPYLTEAYISDDETHPTEAGQKYLGEVLAKEMEKALMSIK